MTPRKPRSKEEAALAVPTPEAERLGRGEHAEPHRVLGAHPAQMDGREGVMVRALHPEALAVECLLEGAEPTGMKPLGKGLFAIFLPGHSLPLSYRLRFRFPGDGVWERDDPYRFLPTLGDVDLHLFNEGTHRRLWQVLGAHPRSMDGTAGVAFAVWAPGARRVSVVGDFCGWDGRLFPMRAMGNSGVFELFVPGATPGASYKYEIKTREGLIRTKTDPFASCMEAPPGTASRVTASNHAWTDHTWMAERARRDPRREPMSIYEVHLGSWARVVEEGNRSLGYREIAPRLVEHVKRLGFTHLELLPVAEHAFYGSWGYQVTGYYAPTARYGTPDDFRYFVDYCHRNGVGVILDWVPAHFPKDDWSLRRYDGTALFEHEDPRLGEHPEWGTLIFNFGRNEVRNFLVANALYWLQEFHVDGLRVDAVASMLYLDYGRKEGEWIPNRHGGRENLEAVDFLRQVNRCVEEECPGAFTVAEESTSWPGITQPVSEGGLGFTFKWNMGWMHDTLDYFARDSVYRPFHQDQLTFAMVYEFSERFVNPLSHDEVVHLKRSLLDKMPGDLWQKFANLRLLLSYQFLRPGKQLLFMGSEIPVWREWNHDVSLDWHLLQDPMHQGFGRFLEALGQLYREQACLWRDDPDPSSFAWIDCSDREQSIISFARWTGEEHLVVVFNFSPVPREEYRIGVPRRRRYVERFCSDESGFGGSQFDTAREVDAEPIPLHGHDQSVRLRLPPLGCVVLAPA